MGERVVKWKKGWTEQEFMSAVVEAGGLARGSLVHLQYAHDESCPKPGPGACRCDPEVTAIIRPAARGAA